MKARSFVILFLAVSTVCWFIPSWFDLQYDESGILGIVYWLCYFSSYNFTSAFHLLHPLFGGKDPPYSDIFIIGMGGLVMGSVLIAFHYAKVLFRWLASSRGYRIRKDATAMKTREFVIAFLAVSTACRFLSFGLESKIQDGDWGIRVILHGICNLYTFPFALPDIILMMINAGECVPYQNVVTPCIMWSVTVSVLMVLRARRAKQPSDDDKTDITL